MRQPGSVRSNTCARNVRVCFYVMLGETDEWAHGRRYDLYLDAARRNDRFIRQFWETAQALPDGRRHDGPAACDRPWPR